MDEYIFLPYTKRSEKMQQKNDKKLSLFFRRF